MLLAILGGATGIGSGAGGGLGLENEHVSRSPFVIYIFLLSV